MIKGTKTIAEYAIKKWLEDNGFEAEAFHVLVDHEKAKAVVIDRFGECMLLRYDKKMRTVTHKFI